MWCPHDAEHLSAALQFRESESCSVVSDSLQPHGLYSPWNSPGQNTGVDSLSLLQGIYPTQGSNPGILDCRRILYQLSHKGSPRILEWVAYLFSSLWLYTLAGQPPPEHCLAATCGKKVVESRPRARATGEGEVLVVTRAQPPWQVSNLLEDSGKAPLRVTAPSHRH